MRAYKTVGPDITVPWLPSSRHTRSTVEPSEKEERNDAKRAQYSIGARVRLVGLVNATHCNGREGNIVGFVEDSGIVYVQLDEEGEVGKGKPIKLIAKFVEHKLDSDEIESTVEPCTSWPACISTPPVEASDDQSKLLIESFRIASNTLHTASSCLLGKASASSWAVEGCAVHNPTTSGGVRTLRSSRGVEVRRRIFGKPSAEFQMCTLEIEGQKFENIDDVVCVITRSEEAVMTLKKRLEECVCVCAQNSEPLRIDVKEAEFELKKVGEILLAVMVAFQKDGRVEEAMEVSSGVLALSRRISGLVLMEAKASLVMAWAKHSAGRHVEARHHASQAGRMYEHLNDVGGQADAAFMLGKCQHGLWQYREASESLLYALTHARFTRNRKRQSEILQVLSKVFADDHPKEALEHAQEALALSAQEEKVGATSASALGALSVAYSSKGEHMSAAQSAQQQLHMCTSEEHMQGKERALSNLGHAQLALGLADEAERTFLLQREAAVGLGDMPGEASALQGLGKALIELRCYELAIDAMREEEVVWDCIGDFWRRRWCLDRLCKLLEQMKCKRDAMEIRLREGVPLHSLAPLFSEEFLTHQLHFDEERVVMNPRLCHVEKPHPWSLPVLPSQYLLWGNRFHLSSSPGRRVMLNFPAGFIKEDFEQIKKKEPEPIEKKEPEPLPPPPPRKSLNLV